MPKKKVSKKQKRIHLNKSNLVIYLCCLLAVCLVGFVAFSRYSHNQRVKREKVMFSNLENAVNDVAKQIEEELGTPTRGGVTPYCQMTGEKFSDGHLFCGVKAGANFPVSSMDQAKEYGAKIVSIFDSNENFGDKGNVYEIPLDDRWTLSTYFAFVGKRHDKIVPCDLDITYLDVMSSSSTNASPGERRPGTAGYIMNCHTKTAEQYYPMN